MDEYLSLNIERLQDAMSRGDKKAQKTIELNMSARLDRPFDNLTCRMAPGYPVPKNAVFPSDI